MTVFVREPLRRPRNPKTSRNGPVGSRRLDLGILEDEPIRPPVGRCVLLTIGTTRQRLDATTFGGRSGYVAKIGRGLRLPPLDRPGTLLPRRS
jgi:hypothetical protein